MAAANKGGAKVALGALSPNATIVALWVIGVVAVLGAYYFLFYGPLDEERVAEEARSTQLAADLRTQEGALRRYNTDVAELARARQHARDLQNVLPNDADIPGFMRNVNSLAEASGLRIQLIEPVDERVEQYFARIPVKIEVRGSYLALARFFHAVSQLPRVINMENIKLQRQQGGAPVPGQNPADAEVALNASVLATTFRSVAPSGGAGAAAGAPGAAPGGGR